MPVHRQSVQHAYDAAPDDLKKALSERWSTYRVTSMDSPTFLVSLDYILEHHLPFYMTDDAERDIYDQYRTGRRHEAERWTYLQQDFVRSYNEASEDLQKVIGKFIFCMATLVSLHLDHLQPVETLELEAWHLIEDRHVRTLIPKGNAAQGYAVASTPLKVVISG